VISGDISKPTDLIEFSEEWFQKAKIDLQLQTTIQSINVKNKTITGLKANGSSFEKSYDELIIATGSNPIIPPIKNIQQNKHKKTGIFSIRTIDDASNILKAISDTKHACIVGAGLIGLEMADSLIEKHIDVTVIEALPFICPMLDEDISTVLQKNIEEYIHIFTNHFATEVTYKDDAVKEIVIKDRNTDEIKTIQTDLLIIATGTKQETTLAQNAGCKIGKTNGIMVNEKTETSIEHVYAVGDCTEYVDFITGKPIPIGLGSMAVRQGIAAGVNAAGGSYTLPKGFLQTFTSRFFHQEIAAVGPLHSFIDSSKIIQGKYTGSSLPEYFPGGKPILMKIAAELDSGRIISAQALGANAAQRINTYATAILAEMNIDCLKLLETAYAPPVAPTLDTVTLVADIVDQKRNRKMNK
jgi:NADH oxidase (H2O2-forming)